MKTYTFHVSGTHCPSCKILIEDTLIEQEGIARASVNLKQKTVLIECENDGDAKDLVCNLSEKIEVHGYKLSQEEITTEQTGVIWKAIPIGLVFLTLFFLLQKSGILDFGIGGGVTPLTSFIIGLIASVSSCLAVVGGLILSLSAKASQDNVSDRKNIILFHTARILGFGLLG